jgi:hypothetical protein
MPATSQKQARYFRWLEHAPDAAAERKKSGMTHQQMHDFAATPDRGLPKQAPHMADGGDMASNQTFQQSETESKKRPEWMERIPQMKAPARKATPMMADGKKAAGYRVSATKIEATPLPAAPRKLPMFGQQPQMMADGKKGWVAEAFAHAGEPGHSLHASLGIPKDQKIPAKRLNAATHSSNPKTRHQAQAAKNI